MLKQRSVSLLGGMLISAAVLAQPTGESLPGEAVERHLPSEQTFTPWVHDPELLKREAGDRLEVQEVVGEAIETVKLTNVIPPIRFESGVANIPERYVEKVRRVLESMRDRRNVRLHLVGHADDQRLSETLVRVYGDNAGLSRERAGEVAEFLQKALMLPPEAVSYEWAGDSRPIASNATPEGRALNRRVEVEVWYDEMKPVVAKQERLVAEDFKRVKVCRVQTLCKLRFKEGHSRRARVKNLVPPLHYEDDTTAPSAELVEHIRKALHNLREKRNVVVRFIGYTDNAPLTGRNERIYGDHLAFSKARAHRVALAVQEALSLPSTAVASEGRGATLPLASNETAQGRALNRRVEVQFWHDDPLQELSDEPQLCPDLEGSEVVTKVYDPPWGNIPALQLENARALIPPGYTEVLRRAMADISERTNVRLRFVGYTANERLDRRTAEVYGDDIGLSAARARRAMETIREQMQLSASQAEHEGRGYLHSRDVVNVGFIQGETSHVLVQVVYDEPAVIDDYEGVDITRMNRELTPKSALGLNLMHITVDGVPIDDPNRSSADVQRCTDVALDRANIQFQFDNLKARPRLSVAASPKAIVLRPMEAGFAADPVLFRMYSNYEHFIDRAEVRVFRADQSAQAVPLAIAGVDARGIAEWQPDAQELPGAARELKYFLRVYGRNGRFDDTHPQLLSIIRERGGEPGETQVADLGRIETTGDAEPASAGVMTGDSAATEPPTTRNAHTAEPITAELDISGLMEPEQGTAYAVTAGPARDGSRVAQMVSIESITPAGLNAGWMTARWATPELMSADQNTVQPVGWTTTGSTAAQMISSAGSITPELTIAESAAVDAATGEPEHVVAENNGSVADGLANGAEESVHPQHIRPEPLDPVREADLLAGYGETGLALQNIQLSSGTVTVRGSGIPAGHTVWVAGRPAPVDANGNFIAEEILPTGTHTVEVAVLDQSGNGELYLRDLDFSENDSFRVGIADFTYSTNRTNGPADLLQGEDAPYDYDSSFDGRLAFYLTEKFRERWRLTASADTREGPVEDLFSNFLNKSPESLFRRIDPDNHYPTFGDDSVVEELAPTLGKFYVKVNRDDDHALWGNFKVNYMENELAHVDRGLYGGNLHWQTDGVTGFGEQRMAIDAFAAEAGTVGGRDEFRGTGGSLYFLRNQDILSGSERARIELRDKDSGLVTGVVNLRPVLDYDIDYLQGRILLAEPLSSTAADNLLVRSGGLNGNEAYLVVRYEYTPGFEDIDALTTGGQGHYWVNDYIRFGMTASTSEEGQSDSSLQGADLTLRKSADSWFKMQTAKSEGLVSSSLYSDDGGFGFVGTDTLSFTDASADGYRADLSVGFGDFLSRGKGRLTIYTQNLGAGYSAPGFATLTDREHFGGTLRLPLGDRLHVNAKADRKVQDLGLETTAQELDIGYQLSEKWTLSTGARKDLRKDHSPVVPLTQEQGERTDAVVQLGFDSLEMWRGYVFVQDTVSKTEDREDNGRIGAGGSYRFTDRLRLDMEVSDGDIGAGGRLGTNYLYSDRTSLYLNYALENERTDNGLRARRGNLISGVKRRLSDSSSVYLEERYQDTDFMSGLTHATGVTLAPNNRWNMGANTEFGTLRDSQTGAETDRQAGGIRIGYGRDAIQLSSGVEYRFDTMEQLDATTADRTTWLFRNNLKYQLTPDWRLVGKLNHSLSNSSLGQFYDGGYSEAVIGYGYRPVLHDRLNALAKYTYFYNVPTTDQITLQDTAAQFIQKSHIASVDFTYDLTSSWSIGGKYAYRIGQMSLEREDPQFFDNKAQLTVVRADWQFRQHWEGLIEGRMLDMPDLNERRAGALIGIYRYLGKHLKMGVGYNFTDFSDDLTDLSFDHHGAFINVIGAM